MKKEANCGSMIGVLLLIGLVGAGCSADSLERTMASIGDPTPYQRHTSSTFTGGYDDEKLTPDVFKVTAEVNAISPRENAVKMVLVHAAEVAEENGSDYFVVIGSRSMAECTTRMNNNGTEGAKLGGAPIEEITIKLLKSTKGSEGSKIVETKKVLQEMRPQLWQVRNYSTDEKVANLQKNRETCYSGTPIKDS